MIFLCNKYKNQKLVDQARDKSQNYRQPETIEDWIRLNKLAPPCPAAVKWMVLERHHIPGAVWIETGTHLGDTTRFLAGFSPHVISIEPSEFYFQEASKALSGLANVELVQGSSENVLAPLLQKLHGQDLCLWLDGHWSGGKTYLGKRETPIELELKTLSKNLRRLGSVAVLIDDFRLCWLQPGTYPRPSGYVRWAESNGLNWTIEQDIFIAKSPNLPLY